MSRSRAAIEPARGGRVYSTADMGYDVFISHSSKNRELADEVCAHLEADGLRCWIAPRDILPGTSWPPAIVEGLERARVVLLVLSQDANSSEQVLREVERACHKHIPVVPLRVEDVTLSKGLEYFLSSAQWKDATGGPIDRHLPDVVETIRTLIARSGRVAPPTGAPVPRPRPAGGGDRTGAEPADAPPAKPDPRPPPARRRRTRRAATVAVAAAVVAAVVVTIVVVAPALRRPAGQSTSRPTPVTDKTFTNTAGMAMVRVDPGEFVMGSPAAQVGNDTYERLHPVRLTRPYFLGATEVTQGQWRQVMGDPNPSEFRGDSLPVEHVTWHDAVRFCAELSRRERRTYRLPTEAEWEYACRAGTTTAFAFGDTISPALVNYDSGASPGVSPRTPFRGLTTPVGTFPPNRWGLYDMHGNVAEWCSDPEGDYPGGDAVTVDPTGPAVPGKPPEENVRMFRGGGWSAAARACRSGYRQGLSADYKGHEVGFRVALDP